jgi:hypothetical protein
LLVPGETARWCTLVKSERPLPCMPSASTTSFQALCACGRRETGKTPEFSKLPSLMLATLILPSRPVAVPALSQSGSEELRAFADRLLIDFDVPSSKRFDVLRDCMIGPKIRLGLIGGRSLIDLLGSRSCRLLHFKACIILSSVCSTKRRIYLHIAMFPHENSMQRPEFVAHGDGNCLRLVCFPL